MYLLDTNIVSELRRPAPDAALVEWLASVDSRLLAISAFTVFEIQVGIAKARANGNHGVATQVSAWLEGLLSTRDLSVLDFDVQVARLYAEMFETPALRDFVLSDSRSRRPKTGVDLIVAATAIGRRASIVTFNSKDFERIHERFALPGLFEPGRKGWIVPEQRGGEP